MKSEEFRHAYLQYVGIYVGGEAIAIDYQLTAYWGEVSAISQRGVVTITYYAGFPNGFKTKEFHPYRCWGDPFDEESFPNGFLETRYSVLVHFKQYVIPKLKAFPELYQKVLEYNLYRRGRF